MLDEIDINLPIKFLYEAKSLVLIRKKRNHEQLRKWNDFLRNDIKSSKAIMIIFPMQSNIILPM